MDGLIPLAVGMQAAMTQQKVAISMLKQAAQVQQQIVGILQGGDTGGVPAGSLGATVNISA